MPDTGRVTVRMFGVLCTLRKERGLPAETEIDVPAEGIPAREIAVALELPVERIEGIFCNHTVYGLGHVIRPGDRLAFVPFGTPGPHRYSLGLYRAGHEEE